MSVDTQRMASSKEDVSAALVEILPDMRAFARSLTKERILADDLVQDATLRALTSAHLYAPGTNFKAWVFTIIRNCFYNDLRLRRRLTALPETMPDMAEQGGQDAPLELCDFRRAFWQLSYEHREALILIGPSGMSYEEAAAVCQCAVGTIKSRVCRARTELRRIVESGNFGISRRNTDPIAPDMDETLASSAAWLSEVPATTRSATSRRRSRARVTAI